MLIQACSHSSSTSGEDGEESVTIADTVPSELPFVADNDIGMTVRSMANTINIGDNLDSTDYNFEGVLTDGVGMPLFTDITGMPGKWEVEVVDSTQVRIRNLSPGDLQPHQLVEYLTQVLDPEEGNIVLESETDEGEVHKVSYRYGKTEMCVSTRPQQIGNTGEVAPVMEITLRADSIP